MCPLNIFYKETIMIFPNIFKKLSRISGISGRRYLSETKGCGKAFNALSNFSN